jgi:CTP synthase (UTP-ammonia lyase)
MRVERVRVGIIGDCNPQRLSHFATVDALYHAARPLAVSMRVCWVATPTLDVADPETVLSRYDALWCAPGSPYESTEGALAAIRYARERDVPFLGT